MYLEFVLGVDAEVTAATALRSPQQIRIPFLAGMNDSPFGIDHFQSDQVVADETDRPLQRSNASSESDATDPNSRAVAKRRDIA